MIGLGSNRLSVCRRGGMSVTQAGRGGMEWLAGGRMPSWASPYSAQATAALKAQFPTQWPTIRDYGFAHPDLVPFINEDPMLVMSLIEGLGERRLVGDATGYFNTGIKPSADMVAKTRFKLGTRVEQYATIFGSRPSNYPSVGGAFSTFYNYQNGGFDWHVQKLDTYIYTYSVGVVYNFEGELTKFKLYEDGGSQTEHSTGQSSLTNADCDIYVFASNQGNSPICKMNGEVTFLELNSATNGNHKFVPFKRNGVMELLDLVSGNLATRVGSFTISETPANQPS